ncbi:rod shape-determining protein MreC [Fructilactobacillus cliffordii]|uniref:rod shape-determining protein MreC n=1 Tax=Fructilactobacillus cliffordii TaxID=2940299 RepID=UPI0020934781|nr:rod shape-determining protein MreC [Fructilactobacillus cliffordii]USS86822.1 rod shape-determining protein MreC [Fructilactobacillus cliffordii]
MQKLFSSRNLVILVICLVLSLGLITGTVAIRNKRATPPIIQRIGNDIAGFGNQTLGFPVGIVDGFFANTNDLLNTYHENRILKGKVDQIEATQTKNAALSSENQQLKRQLKMDKTLTDYTKVNASVIARTPSNWQQQLVINKGKLNGIQKNMPVIVNQGLIGRISEVNDTNSKVELITDSGDGANRFAVEVAGEKGPVDGLISGYNNANNELEMGSLTSKDKIKKGAKVMTNGLGGTTPKGLYVGKVTGISGAANGISEQINIKPAADTRSIDVVSVLGKK